MTNDNCGHHERDGDEKNCDGDSFYGDDNGGDTKLEQKTGSGEQNGDCEHDVVNRQLFEKFAEIRRDASKNSKIQHHCWTRTL